MIATSNSTTMLRLMACLALFLPTRIHAICDTESDALTNCYAGLPGTISISDCLSCVDASIPTSSDATATCDAYQTDFCQAIDTKCPSSCDDNTCGDAFNSYIHCLATERATAMAQLSTCTSIACDGIQNPNNTSIPCVSGCTNFLPFVCEQKGKDLKECQDNDATRYGDCINCIFRQIPVSAAATADCNSYDEQFCTAIPTCNTVCAATTCGKEYADVYSCVAEGTGQAKCSIGCTDVGQVLGSTTSGGINANALRFTVATAALTMLFVAVGVY